MQSWSGVWDHRFEHVFTDKTERLLLPGLAKTLVLKK